MVYTNSTISIITLNINDQNAPIKRQRLAELIKKQVLTICCLYKYKDTYRLKINGWGFPHGSVVKNLPANTGDTGSSSGPGRSHMLQSNEARAPQLLSLLSRACEPQLAHMPQLLKPALLEPMLHNRRSHHNKKPMHCNEE